MNEEELERRRAFRAVIEAFINKRLEDKLKTFKDDAEAERAALAEKYAPEAWLADAARRAAQIQAVTHTLKATHPDARGSNLYCRPDALPCGGHVGSGVLRASFSGDVVGNAAALDVYKFLRVECHGKTLLAWMEEGDTALSGALHDDETISAAWVRAFTGLLRSDGEPASHTLAKQLYWFVGKDPGQDTDFHLLAPLYASSLAYRVFQTIQEDRFGESAKEIRRARREAAYHPGELHEYPDLAVQKLGGTKPQNISQLNSERGGNNYLLASLPPVWKSRDTRPPYGPRSFFERFGLRRDVAAIVAELKRFLESDPPANMATRDYRDDLLDRIIGELTQYVSALHELEPGWSADPRCRLVEAEKDWLDPFRPQDADAQDPEERKADLNDAICTRFANWLNHVLGGAALPLGDIEHAFWANTLDASGILEARHV